MNGFEIRRGDIFYISKGDHTGCEQMAGRPGIIVSNDKANRSSRTVEVVYLTTQPKVALPTHVTIRSTSRESTALCEQITTVSVDRLENFAGHVSKTELSNIETAMLISLDLTISEVTEKIVEVPVQVEVVKEVVSPLEYEVAEEMREVVAIKTERDTYKRLYESLLDKMIC